jgi:hypothetical protein
MQPREIMSAIAKQTGDIGASFYFTPETRAIGKQLGLDGFRFYILGRGGVLGDVDAGVIHSAFGYFHPGLIARLWDSGRETVSPREAASAFIEAAHEHGRRLFADTVDSGDLDRYVDAASTVIAGCEGGAMALFAGLRAEPLPDDAPAAAMHQAMVLRHRPSQRRRVVRLEGRTTDRRRCRPADARAGRAAHRSGARAGVLGALLGAGRCARGRHGGDARRAPALIVRPA